MRTYTLHLASGGVINLHGGPLNEEVAEQPKPACETCRFYVPNLRSPDDPNYYGTCHRHSPLHSDMSMPRRMWPEVLRQDWCGEYERAAQ